MADGQVSVGASLVYAWNLWRTNWRTIWGAPATVAASDDIASAPQIVRQLVRHRFQA